MNFSQYQIPFNKPHLTGKETSFIEDAVKNGQISGNGKYTKLCQNYFQKQFGFTNCLLTTSCTDALEMAAILLDIKEADEVIMPSFTFVSTANAFVLRGAKIIFADSRKDCPNIDENSIEKLITSKTKAIVVVHYSGVACNMGKIMQLANKYDLYVIEDAAQAIDSYYIGHPKTDKKALGSIGHLATFSFHETKNIISGEGGMLVINDSKFLERAEVIWEKGTNRSDFFRKKVHKYEWVDIGSSFLPSDIIAAFLYAQLGELNDIQQKRKDIWNTYYDNLSEWAKKHKIQLPYIPKYATNNAHLFYLVVENQDQRQKILTYLKNLGILAVFHYQSLHKSKFYHDFHGSRELPECDRYSSSLIRLPLFYDLTNNELQYIIESLLMFEK
ncbi:dTDP-4-amino-4,6-dideoxygalactose transaminase [Maribacter sp. 2307UL18-2]|uniref:dTDP-4-amino-4,6-dideoxygalactose transaminase n=1 Tax=Maribacter sp. 2307UL18-2 TaxID=3386274 RepID=UPI0039BD1015